MGSVFCLNAYPSVCLFVFLFHKKYIINLRQQPRTSNLCDEPVKFMSCTFVLYVVYLNLWQLQAKHSRLAYRVCRVHSVWLVRYDIGLFYTEG